MADRHRLSSLALLLAGWASRVGAGLELEPGTRS